MNREKIRGSGNAEARAAEGWVVGSPRYSSSEPHHVRHDGGGWTYEEMYSLAREELLMSIIEGGAGAGGEAEIWLRERFPRKSADAARDYAEAESMGTIRTYLVRNLSGIYDEVPLSPTTGFDIFSDGWDESQAIRGEWVCDSYSATISRG